MYNFLDFMYSGMVMVFKFFKFDVNVLLGVFLGNITRWNDVAITALNSTMMFLNELIKIVVC